MTEIEINGFWNDTQQKFTMDAAIGQYDGKSNDDNIFYWFDTAKEVNGEHDDFTVESFLYTDKKALQK